MNNTKTNKLKTILESAKGNNSLDWLANQIGVSKSTLYQWITGKSYPDPSNLKKISSFLNKSYYDLVAYLEEIDTRDCSEFIPVFNTAEEASVSVLFLSDRERVKLIQILANSLILQEAS